MAGIWLASIKRIRYVPMYVPVPSHTYVGYMEYALAQLPQSPQPAPPPRRGGPPPPPPSPKRCPSVLEIIHPGQAQSRRTPCSQRRHPHHSHRWLSSLVAVSLLRPVACISREARVSSSVLLRCSTLHSAPCAAFIFTIRKRLFGIARLHALVTPAQDYRERRPPLSPVHPAFFVSTLRPRALGHCCCCATASKDILRTSVFRPRLRSAPARLPTVAPVRFPGTNRQTSQPLLRVYDVRTTTDSILSEVTTCPPELCVGASLAFHIGRLGARS